MELWQDKYRSKQLEFDKLESRLADKFKLDLKVHTEELDKTKEKLVKFRELCAALKVSLDSRDAEVLTTKAANDELQKQVAALRIKSKEMTLKSRAMEARAKRKVVNTAKEVVAKAIEKRFRDQAT